MTPEQTALLARLNGWSSLIEMNSVPDYDDLNNLMPLAEKFLCDFWKLDNLWYAEPCGDAELCSSKNLKEAIQQALLAIAREKFKC